MPIFDNLCSMMVGNIQVGEKKERTAHILPLALHPEKRYHTLSIKLAIAYTLIL